MGYLPDFRHDIFVSYAHVDDIPWHGIQDGWVTTLISNIKKQLATHLGRTDAYSLWMDDKLAEHVELTQQIMEALNNTAILIIILSPGYVASDWCTREKNIFFQMLRNKRSGIFVIERSHIEPDERPQELAEFVPFQFWIKDREGMPPKILGEPEPSKDVNYLLYFDKVNEVAFKLKNLLHELKRQVPSGSNELVQKKEVSVFLADTTDDLEQARNGIKKYLSQFDIKVLPDSCYSLEPTSFRIGTERDLAGCRAFVQLLSTWPGKKPADLPKGYLQLQYECAVKAGVPIFQWRNLLIDISAIEDEDHLALVNGEKVRAEGFEEFKLAVKEYVLKAPPVKPFRASQSSMNPTSDLNTLVFVNMETSDRPLAEKVCCELKRHGIGYSLPLLHGEASEIRSDLEANLVDSNGIIIIYGCSTVAWVRRQLLECRKMLSKREKPIQAFAIFEGPPEEKCPIDLMLPNLQLLDMKKGIDDEHLDHEISAFIESLVKENA